MGNMGHCAWWWQHRHRVDAAWCACLFLIQTCQCSRFTTERSACPGGAVPPHTLRKLHSLKCVLALLSPPSVLCLGLDNFGCSLHVYPHVFLFSNVVGEIISACEFIAVKLWSCISPGPISIYLKSIFSLIIETFLVFIWRGLHWLCDGADLWCLGKGDGGEGGGWLAPRPLHEISEHANLANLSCN